MVSPLANERPGTGQGEPMRSQLWAQSIRSNDQCQNSPALGHRQLYAKGNTRNDREAAIGQSEESVWQKWTNERNVDTGTLCTESKNGHFCMFVDSCVWRIFDNIWLHNSKPFISMSVRIPIRTIHLYNCTLHIFRLFSILNFRHLFWKCRPPSCCVYVTVLHAPSPYLHTIRKSASSTISTIKTHMTLHWVWVKYDSSFKRT